MNMEGNCTLTTGCQNNGLLCNNTGADSVCGSNTIFQTVVNSATDAVRRYNSYKCICTLPTATVTYYIAPNLKKCIIKGTLMDINSSMVVCQTATPTLKSDYTGCVLTCASNVPANSPLMNVNGVPTCIGTTATPSATLACLDDGCGCQKDFALSGDGKLCVAKLSYGFTLDGVTTNTGTVHCQDGTTAVANAIDHTLIPDAAGYGGYLCACYSATK